MNDDRQATMRVSDEASAEGLRLADAAGQAYQRMVRYFIENIADDGRIEDCGDYRVGVAVEKAEPLWRHRSGQLALQEPASTDNQHVEVIVTDRADGRFLPGLQVNLEAVADDGTSVGAWDLPFLWHPTMFHYGRNVAIPRSGRYSLNVSIARPTFARHDKVNGRRYEHPVLVQFVRMRLTAGREAR
jgi:hypothetical protein